MSLVLDSSITLGWVLEDETTDAILHVFDMVVEQGAIVPALWRLEVANALSMSVRRRRITSDVRDAALADLALLDIAVDAETNAHAWATTLRLADGHGLTLHDAAYLELAIRQALPLASLDNDLRAAAGRLGVRMLGA